MQTNYKGGHFVKKILFTLGTVALLSTTTIPETTAFAQAQTIEQTEKELSNVKTQIQRFNQAILDNENLMKTTEKNIQHSQQELKALEKETEEIKGRIDMRTEILENRIRALQAEGSKISYLDVLLNADNFGDFISRISAVTQLMEADQDLMTQQEKDAQKIIEKEQAIKETIQKLEEEKTELLGMKEQIKEQKQQTLHTKDLLEQQRSEQKALQEAVEKEKAARNVAKQEQITKETTKETMKVNTKDTTKEKTKKVVSQKVANVPSPSTTNVEQSKSGSVETVIAAGNKYIGNSVYVFGGGRTSSDIANGRFDCSGFVSWAFKQAGVSVPAYTGGLVGIGSRVSVSEMKPGDLVFFDTYKKDGHVGIYIGGGKFIGSQSSTGVGIADLNKGYWKDKFNGRVNRVL